ncbi:MAG TPA: hypothetical protein VHY83_14175 [Solirubrobacteraceae bacterium]|nr:hypothetical protein [Solirubrobacteraceae bacterium]
MFRTRETGRRTFLCLGGSLAALTAGLIVAVGASASPRSIEEFSIPTAASQPTGIAAGPDGAVWFTEKAANKVGRITVAGAVTEFTIPTAGSEPTAIAAGPDGNIWFTESAANLIGRFTPAGGYAQFAIPTAASIPSGITAGPDGNVWFTEKASSKIGKITPAGVVTETSTLFADTPAGIGHGPLGSGEETTWYVSTGGNHVGYAGPGGSGGETTIKTASSAPLAITQGSDGAAWFTESATFKIGRISELFGCCSEYNIDGNPAGIASGSDGALWFTEPAQSRVARMTVGGVETDSTTTPTASSEPFGITAGPDGAIWFTEKAANKIGRIVLPPLPTGPIGPTGPAGTAGAPGPPGPAGPAGAAGKAAPITLVAFQASVSKSSVTVRYVLTGPASVSLVVKPPHGSSVKVANGTGLTGVNTLTWNRKLRGKKAARGTYKLSVQAKAGSSQVSSALSARLR